VHARRVGGITGIVRSTAIKTRGRKHIRRDDSAVEEDRGFFARIDNIAITW
jgi:hypothetical protein